MAEIDKTKNTSVPSSTNVDEGSNATVIVLAVLIPILVICVVAFFVSKYFI